jgi:hypothetical protein
MSMMTSILGQSLIIMTWELGGIKALLALILMTESLLLLSCRE